MEHMTFDFAPWCLIYLNLVADRLRYLFSTGAKNMRTQVQKLAAVLVLVSASAMAQEKIGADIMITPVEHASLVIQGEEKTVFVDPVGDVKSYALFPKPDLILVTHMHQDHLAPDVIAAVKKPETEVVGPGNVIEQLKYGTVVKNGQTTTVQGMTVEAIPAYNTSADRTKFHPKGRDNGYVLTLDGKRIYISGDTEDTKEMRALKNIDFALICINLPYTMTVEQAASAVLEIKPKIVTPYHYRGAGGMSDLEGFKRQVAKDPAIEVRLMKWYGKK